MNEDVTEIGEAAPGDLADDHLLGLEREVAQHMSQEQGQEDLEFWLHEIVQFYGVARFRAPRRRASSADTTERVSFICQKWPRLRFRVTVEGCTASCLATSS